MTSYDKCDKSMHVCRNIDQTMTPSRLSCDLFISFLRYRWFWKLKFEINCKTDSKKEYRICRISDSKIFLRKPKRSTKHLVFLCVLEPMLNKILFALKSQVYVQFRSLYNVFKLEASFFFLSDEHFSRILTKNIKNIIIIIIL